MELRVDVAVTRRTIEWPARGLAAAWHELEHLAEIPGRPGRRFGFRHLAAHHVCAPAAAGRGHSHLPGVADEVGVVSHAAGF